MRSQSSKDRARRANLARYYANREPWLAKQKQRHANSKAEMIAAYGGQCVCCGETESAFLTIDHLHNDGKKHRKLTGSAFYRWLKLNGWPRNGFALKCMNCNFARRFGRECPHVKQAQRFISGLIGLRALSAQQGAGQQGAPQAPQASMAPAAAQSVDASGMMGQDKPMGGESSTTASQGQ